jgi:hypothetical protein
MPMIAYRAVQTITRHAVLAFLIPSLGAVLLGQSPRGVLPRVPDHPDSAGKYVFYLHGRIVEDQGPDAVSTEYGRYEYSSIVQKLAGQGFTVVSEARAANTDPASYADAVVQQIRRLIAAGVKPSDVTVIGASKGSMIAMLVSTRLTDPVRYVLMANCNDSIFKAYSLALHGHVLSIYEESDEFGQTCRTLFNRSPQLGERREMRLTTGLRHGFIYRPLDAWLKPAVAWARGSGTE